MKDESQIELERMGRGTNRIDIPFHNDLNLIKLVDGRSSSLRLEPAYLTSLISQLKKGLKEDDRPDC